MHLTLEADYAVRIVLALAAVKKRLDAKSIAEEAEVTLRFSLKILRKLVCGGVVRSFKGTQGGYELAKPPSSITLYDVISIVEGEISISRCLNDDFVCNKYGARSCATQRVFDEISVYVRSKLESVTIDKLLP